MSRSQRGGEVVLGRYRLQRRLAAGSAGSVFSAVDLRTGGSVAVKCFDGSHDNYASWLDETRLVLRLSHPNISRSLDVGHDHHLGVDVLVFERALGGSLRRALVTAGVRMTKTEVRVLLRDVASALVHAHHLGVVHRDVKPENILALREQGRAPWALTDFGVGSHVGAAASAALVGSAGYIAPECLRGELSPRSDQYSLGVVGVETLTGSRPGLQESARFAHEFRGRGGLPGIVARMVASSPARRYPGMRAVLRALDPVGDGAHDVTHADDRSYYFLDARGVLTCPGDPIAAAEVAIRAPALRRFCSARGDLALAQGTRRVVALTDRARTVYSAETEIDVLAASANQGVAWIRRRGEIAAVRWDSMREAVAPVPDSVAGALVPNAPRLGAITGPRAAGFGVVGARRWIRGRIGERGRVRFHVDVLPQALRDVVVLEGTPYALVGDEREAALLRLGEDEAQVVERRRVHVANVVITGAGTPALEEIPGGWPQ